jgi:hypothetical protein
MNADCQITAVPLGEFRMGVEGFGANIIVKSKPIRCLEKEIVFVKPRSAASSNWYEEFVEFSEDGRFLLLHGEFSTFVIDIECGTLSLFKDTIRSPDGIWCEEISILGRDTCHVSGTRRHYYLQFPFWSDSDFIKRRGIYHELRLRQIEEARDRKFT